MNGVPNFILSLLITIVLAFISPLLLVGGMLLFTVASSYLPGLQEVSQGIMMSILEFLATFGSGNSLTGLVVIALTFTLVGILFDTYAFYRYLILRGQE
jgi:hypothetical protein